MTHRVVSRILAIDFDQVIHDKLHPIVGRRMGKPFPMSKSALERFKRHGDTIIIHTTMALTEGGKKAVEDWMKYYDIPYDRVEPKVQADLYLDDKAIRHKDWMTTLDEVHKITNHLI